MVASKSFTIIWDRDALDNLKEILTHLSKQSNLAPKIVKETILSKLETIKTNAFICETDKLKDVSNPNFRAFIVYSYRITYQIKMETQQIRIIRIRHTSREPLGY
jgi:plasmid stabilization system protein ParE